MKIAVLLSGGVDSSVALFKLKKEGHDLTAFYLKIWLEDDASFLGECPWEDDLNYARKVCEQLDVPLEIIPLQREYYDKVVSYTLNELKSGRTPSPDIFCNKMIKFGAFFDKIDQSFDKVATGHYARIEQKDDNYFLKMAPDPIKDQTYFLCHMSKEQLKRTLFPIGEMIKSDVRALAEELQLSTMHRKDSQGICFLGKIKFRDFAKNYLGEKKGEIIEIDTGKKIGEHKGYWFYTIGQRSGLGLSGGPWYVVKKDTKDNIIYISHNYDSTDKARDTFKVGNFNWINEIPKKKKLKCKIRHGPERYDCDLELNHKEGKEMTGIVRLSSKDQGIAQGQFSVFYDEDVCLGCGMIIE